MSKFLSFFNNIASTQGQNTTFARMNQINRSESAHSVAIRILLAQSRLMSMR